VGRLSILCGVMAMVVVVGCGGSSPEDKCQDLVDTMCDRVTACLNVPSQKADCVRTVSDSASCSRTKSVTESYDTCLDELRDVSCDALLDSDANGDPVLNIPSSCRGVLQSGRLAPSSMPLLGVRGAERLIGP